MLVALTLAGCASGKNFAPVDEVGSSRQGGVAARVVTSSVPAAPSSPPTGVQVTTIPYGDTTTPRPLSNDELEVPPQGHVPAPAATSVASLAAPAAVVPVAVAPTPSTLSPAVVALVNDADQRAGAGQHDRAAASLERALQVEPSNAWLWHRLARERFAQGRVAEAESLAGRSNSLAAGDTSLQAGNWRLIEQARRRRGDTAGADDAARRVSGLERG